MAIWVEIHVYGLWPAILAPFRTVQPDDHCAHWRSYMQAKEGPLLAH
jgi:hypothetical protein